MILYVWWEDARNKVKPRNFGPEKLLVACVADELEVPRAEVQGRIESLPLKGDGNVLRRLRRVCDVPPGTHITVVLDRDQIHEAILRLAPTLRPNDCMQEISQAIRAEAPGDYDLVFLVDNMESLFDACCGARHREPPRGKPDPLTRDDALNAVAFGQREWRDEIRKRVVSFDRLVSRIAQQLKNLDA
jgi:hypothetical protein